MAIYSFNAGIVKRSSGQFVTAAAAYRAGERIHDETSGLTHDYTRKKDVDAKEILLPQAAPEWMNDRAQLWTTVERIERRCDAQLARKLMFALPAELSPTENQQLVRGFLHESCVSKGMVADVCYHGLDSHNPHAHVLLTLRRIDNDGFGGKERTWNDKAMLQGWRQQWQDNVNEMLEEKGFQERIDHRTLKEQGIERIAQIHLGPNVAAMRDKGIASDRGDLYAHIEERNEEMTNLVEERNTLDQEIARLEALYQNSETNDEINTGGDAEGVPQEKDEFKTENLGQSVGGDVPHPLFSDMDKAKEINLSSSLTDATTQAVHAQLQAVGAERYEVMLTKRRKQDGKMERQMRRWDPEEVTRSIPWLKRMNAQGYDVMLRPEANQGFIILDQLNKYQVERMRADGLDPALVLNTHRKHYQAWVKIADAALSQAEVMASAQIMAQTYQCSTHSWQYGRLAGFTNHRTWLMEGEQAPFVRVIDTHGQVPVSAPQLREQAQYRVNRYQDTANNQEVVKGLPKGLDGCFIAVEEPFKSERDAADYEFKYWYQKYLNRFGMPRDTSRTDWKMCHILAMRGYSANAIKAAMRQQSPDEYHKSGGNFEQYVERMVYKVMRRPEVIARREEMQRDWQQGRVHQRINGPEIEI